MDWRNLLFIWLQSALKINGLLKKIVIIQQTQPGKNGALILPRLEPRG